MRAEFPDKMDRQTPFNVPEAYFESLEERIMARVSRESAPGGTGAARLDTAGREPFGLPQDYFDTLPERIMGRLKGEPRKRRAGSIAAACLVILISVLGLNQVRLESGENENFLDLVNFDEGILMDEYLDSYTAATDPQQMELESYILNQVDEGLILQEL